MKAKSEAFIFLFSVQPNVRLSTVAESQWAQKETTQTWGKHAKSTKKIPWIPGDMNTELFFAVPRCC